MNTWHITEIEHNTFIAEDGVRTEYVVGEHCPACVYTKLVLNYGGNVDLRGLHRYHSCYQLLAVLVNAERDEEKHGKKNDLEK